MDLAALDILPATAGIGQKMERVLGPRTPTSEIFGGYDVGVATEVAQGNTGLELNRGKGLRESWARIWRMTKHRHVRDAVVVAAPSVNG